MSACERCWGVARVLGREYRDVLRDAEERGEVCTQDTPEGRKAKAGQWWDEATQRDSRTVESHGAFRPPRTGD